MIEAAINSILLVALVASVEDRIYPGKAPQKVTTPYVVYSKISSPRDHTHDGASGLCKSRIQVAIFSEDYLEVKQVVDSVREALDGYKGTSEGVRIDSCLLINEQDLPEPTMEQVSLDFQIIHNE